MSLTLAIITSFLVTLTMIPLVIRVSKSVNVLDQPDKRKIHSISTPSLGGIAIFFGIIFGLLIAASFTSILEEKYFLGGILLIFLLGVRDDLSSLRARHKLVIQLFSAVLIVFFAGVKISGLHGLFGIYSFPWFFDQIFTVFIIVVMTNAFNLIDGIDGLAGGIGFIISLCFCFLFFSTDLILESVLALCIAGSLLGFLIYNWHPSKVFMGDTGSMMLGFILSVMLVKFLQIPMDISVAQFSPVAITFALFILPIYDTLRVLVIRLATGKHPLDPDRNHIHHVLLKLGYNHAKAASILVLYNVTIIGLVFAFQSIGELWLILFMSLTTVSLGVLLDRKVMKRESARMSSLSSEMEITKSA